MLGGCLLVSYCIALTLINLGCQVGPINIRTCETIKCLPSVYKNGKYPLLEAVALKVKVERAALAPN